MQEHQHFILHKPHGYLSQFISNQNKRRNKKLLGTLYNFPEGTMAIGRLDENSEGLLLLTTDGKLSEYIRSNKIEKEYLVQVDGLINDSAIDLLKNGVQINVNGSSYTTKQCNAYKNPTLGSYPIANRKVRDERHGPTSWLSITLTEGKFRQVRKMTAAVGFPTLRLVRVRVGEILLNIKEGEVSKVSEF